MTHLSHGPTKGSVNDICLWWECEYRDQKEELFGDKKILFDGIYDSMGELFITPIKHAENTEQEMFNMLQREDRVIIENKFSRQQGYWPIIALPFTMREDLLSVVYRCCVILTNILILHQNPMRQA